MIDPFKTFEETLKHYISEKSIIELKKRWNEKIRFYHNTTHLVNIIEDIGENVLFNDLYPFEKRTLLLAAFFHDAIYDAKRKDNEDQSIKFFKASYISDDAAILDNVIKLIETTKHRKRPFNRLEKIFWDADNAKFKKGYNELLKNEKLIRKEYHFVPIKEYKENRIKFLESCLGLFGSSTDKDIKKLLDWIEKNY